MTETKKMSFSREMLIPKDIIVCTTEDNESVNVVEGVKLLVVGVLKTVLLVTFVPAGKEELAIGVIVEFIISMNLKVYRMSP